MNDPERYFPACIDLPRLSTPCGGDTTGWDGSGSRVCWRQQAGEACSAPTADICGHYAQRIAPLAVIGATAYPDVAQRGLEERGGW